MSFFMVGGSLAYTIGPLLAVGGCFVVGVGRHLAAGASGDSLVGVVVLAHTRRDHHSSATQKDSSLLQSLRELRRVFLPITGIVIAQGFMLSALSTFLPAFMKSEGANLWVAGSAFAVYEVAGALGALTSGTLSDRLGRRRVLVFFSLAAPTLTLLFLLAKGWAAILMLLVVGFTALSANPVMMALVQEYSRDHPATANGLYFALNFVSKALIIVLVGAMADWWGLRAAYQWSALLGFAALPFVLLLPQTAPCTQLPSNASPEPWLKQHLLIQRLHLPRQSFQTGRVLTIASGHLHPRHLYQLSRPLLPSSSTSWGFR